MTRAWSKRNAAIGLIIGSLIALTLGTLVGLENDNSDGFLEVLILNFLGAGFAVIVIACLPFLIISKAQFLFALKDLSLPIGLIMSCFGLVIFLVTPKPSFYVVYVLPAVAGGMLSLTLADEVKPKSVQPLGFFRAFVVLLWIMVVCHAFYLLIHDGKLGLLWFPSESLSALLVASLFCLYNPIKAPIHKRLGLGAIASIILAVSLSVIGFALATQSDNPELGHSIAFGIGGMINGLWIYISSIVVGKLAYSYSSDTNRSNWHLAEIFIFFLFLILAPRSLFDGPNYPTASEQNVQATETDKANKDASSRENSTTTE